MGTNVEITDIVEKTRLELLFAIKEKVKDITCGCDNKPIYFNGIEVRNRSDVYNNVVSYFKVHNIFVDEKDLLRGDFISENDSLSNGVFFGRSLRDLYVDDLKRIMDALYDNTWHIEEDADLELQLAEDKVGFYEHFIRKYIDRVIIQLRGA